MGARTWEGPERICLETLGLESAWKMLWREAPGGPWEAPDLGGSRQARDPKLGCGGAARGV